ncbi:branched-chain amino acid ABC transporter substrate-binding protein [Marinobacterium nitratireducens]|uniref:Branched-chain amino acid ABC transporter substrate-binding protein n=1 Tax=Marinobacterium nitratireducens TaxID=518897 RepID=A0A917Z5F5_9GAMM|nr:ABC transporter substrate-binding protein [Marinobacterium nitratireducens]GGO75605.1 branched-chain amino acid ABC transporter substrate-binding protein [Marinobacterium nitratireducens]
MTIPTLARSCGLALALIGTAVRGAGPIEVDIGYLSYRPATPPALSNILPEPRDTGLRGAELGIDDSNTTGRFLQQKYRLHSRVDDEPRALLQQASELAQAGVSLFVADLPAAQLTALSEQLGQDALIFNAGSSEDALRRDQCLANVLHTLPSRAMLTDALAQWLAARRWRDWLLIVGNQPQDLAYAQALHRAAKRYGGRIVDEKAWSFDTDLRRSAQKELPLFTQGKDYDVVLVADERGDFGEYVLYNSWLPRPVAGTQGLTPVAWHRVVEQWGAAQLQSRFEDKTGRWMDSRDYAAWAGVRSIAEAVTQLQSTDSGAIRDFLLSERFQLAAFKGRKLSYRPWSGQLRQPIALVHPRALVSQSPQEGILHPHTDLDSLGFDAPESQCAELYAAKGEQQ